MNYNEIFKNITSKDIVIMNDLYKLYKEACDDYKLIIENLTFKVNEFKKILWQDEHNIEYVIVDAENKKYIWVADYLHQHYKVTISVSSIFDVYKENYFHHKNPTVFVNNVADSERYFKCFVKSLKTKEELE